MLAFANDKLRGGYYTEPKIAQWLCDWAIRAKTDTVLEPSCGDGVFLEAAAKRLMALRARKCDIASGITGVEIVRKEADKATQRLRAVLGGDVSDRVQCSEFFDWHAKTAQEHFDCAVGNPPFIRYHNFPEPARSTAMALMMMLGLKANRLTNIWVPFVLLAAERLSEGGRIAMVLPAEILQVSYAAQLRRYLVENFHSIDVLACNQLFFENAQQEVVLLLADGKSKRRASRAACSVDLQQFGRVADILGRPPEQVSFHRRRKVVNHETEKWLKYFLSPREIGLMRALRRSAAIGQLSDHASVDVGVVTGKNRFFVVSDAEVEEWDLEKHVTPLVGRTVHLKGAVFLPTDWACLAADGQRVFLFSIPPAAEARMTSGARQYIAQAERLRLHTTYKCSIRDPWYELRSVWTPDCFLFRQIHDFPRIVVNRTNATSTDTIHRVKCRSDRELLVSNLYTHLTAACAEIEGRSYGGGVLELEPTEAERLLVPAPLGAGLPTREIDACIRDGRLADALDEGDRLVLMDGTGLSKRDCATLKRIWVKMMERRRSRRRRKRQPSLS